MTDLACLRHARPASAPKRHSHEACWLLSVSFQSADLPYTSPDKSEAAIRIRGNWLGSAMKCFLIPLLLLVVMAAVWLKFKRIQSFYPCRRLIKPVCRLSTQSIYERMN
jgi:hypothetical protein